VLNLVLPDEVVLQDEFRPDFLNGDAVLGGEALAVHRDGQGKIEREPQPFMAIPY